jgi:predicted esterase
VPISPHDRAVPPSSRRQRRRSAGLTGTALACLAAFVVAALAPAANAAPPPQVSLKITAGSVTTSEGRLKGSATVGNSGAPVHQRFFVDLIVQLNGPDRRLRRTSVPRLGTGASRVVHYNLQLPTTLPIGRHQIWACVGHSGVVPEPSVLIGCREVGGVNVPVPRLIPTPVAPTLQPPSPQQSPAPAPTTPSSPTAPSAPIAYEAGVPMVRNDTGTNYYWVDVPASYDPSNGTPTKLFVWLPSCGGEASQDIGTVSPSTVAGTNAPRDWISIAVGERGDECWDPNTDGSLVTNAIADVETHFNIDRHRVILGGYAEGGSLAYRLAFYDSNQFAGLLAENTRPFAETGSTQSASLAAATSKLHVVHLAHLQDGVYPIAQVRQETEAMVAAGFPLTRLEVDGAEYDEPGATENGHAVPGTYADLVTLLLPHIDDGWTSP